MLDPPGDARRDDHLFILLFNVHFHLFQELNVVRNRICARDPLGQSHIRGDPVGDFHQDISGYDIDLKDIQSHFRCNQQNYPCNAKLISVKF